MVVEYTEFKECFWGDNGFDRLKRYMNQGTDFCKELTSILNERAENEIAYAKNLTKTSQRLQKLAKDFNGNLSDAWLKASLQFDAEAEMHKLLASSLQEDIVKPIKILVDNNLKSRKPVEMRIEKLGRTYTDKKNEDSEYRTRCFQLVKEIEKLWYSLDEAQRGASGQKTKEVLKIEASITKKEEQLKKSEEKYHKACAALEQARQELEAENFEAFDQLQQIETNRLSQLEQFLKKLAYQMGLLSDKMTRVSQAYDHLGINVSDDIKLACRNYGTRGYEPEMQLYDIYAENTKNMMNKDRRIENLKRWVELLNVDLQRQINMLKGIEKLKISETNKLTENNVAQVEHRTESIKLLQTLYESSLVKIYTAISELNDTQKPDSSYINKTCTVFNKEGIPFTKLKLDVVDIKLRSHRPSAPSPPVSPSHNGNITQMPMPMRIPPSYFTNSYETNQYISGADSVISTASSSSSNFSSVSPSPSMPAFNSTSSLAIKRNSFLLTTNTQLPPSYNACTNSTTTPTFENHYNNSNQSFSDDDDSDWDDEPKKMSHKCLVQYDYNSTRDDELSMHVGDEIEIIEKVDGGWWKGKLNDKIGLFPSNFVLEI